MQVNSTSFAVHEAVLFLDTHPDDAEAMEFYRKWNQKRRRAVADYEERYGSLTDRNVGEGASWEWIQGPWPWEVEPCKKQSSCFATSVEKEEQENVDL